MKVENKVLVAIIVVAVFILIIGDSVGNILSAHTPCDDGDCYYQWQCDSQGQCEDIWICNH